MILSLMKVETCSMIRDLRVGALSLMRVGTFSPTRDLRVGTCMVIDESRGMVIYEWGHCR